jgi:endogenous inhibitor of DNA gyrase (YacG/DUF329 family)
MSMPAPHTCPICGREAPLRQSAPSQGEPSQGAPSQGAPSQGAPRPSAFPFCSPACKLVDLGRWLDGDYRIPGPPVEEPGVRGDEE